MSEKQKEISDLINKIRGTTPSSELQKEVENIIKADEAKAITKAELEANALKDIKAKEKLLRKVKKQLDTKDKKTTVEKDRDKTGKFTKKEPETPEENEEKDDTDNETIKKLTEQMAKMSEEIAALKKRKNYRTAPPAAEKVDEVDDFVKQNITKNFEMIV